MPIFWSLYYCTVLLQCNLLVQSFVGCIVYCLFPHSIVSVCGFCVVAGDDRDGDGASRRAHDGSHDEQQNGVLTFV